MPHIRSSACLSIERSAILVIDLQEKLVPAVPSGRHVAEVTERLLHAADLLGVPSAATVQYPKGLGPLVGRLAERFPDPEEKLDFSAAVCRRELELWLQAGRDQIVITGIETHVCVLQTVLDLLAEGLSVFVVSEAVAARGGREHETALDQMRDAGATITTIESVLFQWLQTADRPEFKSISALIKQPRR
ncbi:isochorismatase family protein [Stieleria varia]|uniref:Isochorismatase n=1 Tax=Stieleria varia TaxID=2528005 RepID=A0A5C6B5H4_9BACT|nr:isochorismatase family protein [Stieleria varia]TWU05734.1 Isochorismatase [Stieleria varia]